jgi:hypothetical protein
MTGKPTVVILWQFRIAAASKCPTATPFAASRNVTSILFISRYSDKPFNTSEIIGSHWSKIPGHLPSAAVFLGLPLTIIGCGWMGTAAI